MKVKSYYADSIQSAMASASQEMGPDAILITSRRTNNETRGLGEYEVVFGLMSESEQARLQAPTEAQSQRPQAEPADPTSGMDAIRRELEAMRRTLATMCRNGAG